LGLHTSADVQLKHYLLEYGLSSFLR